jgi:diaminohydroxyphosphoribosylaminopyrimidine deaminase/5-amino-6-(5-phosphoribosylamino)uracil reductase
MPVIRPDNPSIAADFQDWGDLARTFRLSGGFLPPPWEEIFAPLRTGTVDDLMVVAQCGQSVDARIATHTGHSHYINGAAGLTHLHRLRSLVDAVVVGVGTAIADNPQLTVRRVTGPNPTRVVLDPNGRLPAGARLLAADGVRRIVVTKDETPAPHASGVEVVRVAAPDGRMAPDLILAALADRGLRRILIEGGAETVSRFLAAGALDRLHIMIAPIIMGSGQPSLTLPPIARVEEAIGAPMRAHVLGDEVLLDCDLSAHRMAIGRAKMST